MLILALKQIEYERILGNDMDSFLRFLLCTSYGGTAATNEIRAGKTWPWTGTSFGGQTAIGRCLCLGLIVYLFKAHDVGHTKPMLDIFILDSATCN
jgi:hypothetical protein